MKVLALISGGKDSCYNMLLCQRHGHEIVALGNLLPAAAGVDELDSYMFQTVGHNVIPLYAECMGIPLYRRHISGSSVNQGLSYRETESDEVEDMLQLIAHIKRCHPGIEAVSSGAIASDYQRLRVEHVCARLGLTSLAYMWHQPQATLLQGMIAAGVEAILIKVAALGLVPRRHLGRTLQEMEPHLHKMCREYGCNICGEGGEYETLVLDCPLFSRARIILDAWEIEHLSAGDVAILRPTKFHTQPKVAAGASSTAEEDLPSASNAFQVHVVPIQQGCVQHQAPSRAEQKAQGPRFHAEPEMCSSRQALSASCAPQAVGSLGGTTSADEAEAALDAALEGISKGLEQHSLSLADAVFVHLYLADMGSFAAANRAYSRHFPAVSPAARACIQTPLPQGVPLAVDVLFRPGAPRQVLHVQSVSEWAPSCIGPYAQAVSANGLVHFAGQIGLDPPTMSLVPGGAEPQAIRSLLSCQAVSTAAKADLQQAMLGCTVYAALPASGASTTACPDAIRQSSRPRTAGSASSVTQTFSHVLQILTELQQDEPVKPSAASGQAQVPGELQQTSPSRQHGSGMEHGGLQSATQAASSEGSLPCEGASEEEEAEGSGYGEGSEQEEGFVDEYLRPREAAATVPVPLLTYVEAAALPKGAAVELQPLAFSSSQQDIHQDPPDLQRMCFEFPATGEERRSMGEDCERPAAAAVEAVVWPGRLCYLQVTLREAVPAVRTAPVGYSIAMALRRADVSADSIESARVYYCVSKASKEEACGLMQKVQEEVQAYWAPIFVPVVSVGSTPAADAALVVVMLAMEKPCLEMTVSE